MNWKYVIGAFVLSLITGIIVHYTVKAIDKKMEEKSDKTIEVAE